MSTRTMTYRHLKFGFDLKNDTFSFFHTAISRNSLDLDNLKFGVIKILLVLNNNDTSVPNFKRFGGVS